MIFPFLTASSVYVNVYDLPPHNYHQWAGRSGGGGVDLEVLQSEGKGALQKKKRTIVPH